MASFPAMDREGRRAEAMGPPKLSIAGRRTRPAARRRPSVDRPDILRAVPIAQHTVDRTGGTASSDVIRSFWRRVSVSASRLFVWVFTVASAMP